MSVKKAVKKIGYSLADGVTQSLLSNFIQCRQQAEFFVTGWESALPKDSLAFGSLFHWLLESYYNSIIKGNPVMDFEVHYKEWFKTIGVLMSDQSKVELMAAKAAGLFKGYVSKWKEDLKRDWVSVESQFDVKFNGFRLRGMRDGVFMVKGKPWLLETKTMAQIREDTLTDALSFDFQNLFYITASELTIKKPIVGVLYNIARTPSLKPGDNLGDFASRIEADVLARPETYFIRYEITYSEAVKKRFATELVMKLKDFEHWMKGESWTYRNEKACIGKWSCEFLSACASGNMSGYSHTREVFRELHSK